MYCSYNIFDVFGIDVLCHLWNSKAASYVLSCLRAMLQVIPSEVLWSSAGTLQVGINTKFYARASQYFE